MEPRDDANRLAGTLRTVALAAAAAVLVWLLAGLIALIFLAVLLAVVLRGAADWAARQTRTSPIFMLFVVCVLILSLLTGFLVYLGPQLVSQVHDLWAQLRQLPATLRHAYGGTAIGQAALTTMSQAGQGLGGHVAGYATTVAAVTLDSVMRALIVIVTALYLAISPGLYLDGAVKLFPLHWRRQARLVMLDIGHTLQWWSLGQLIDMLVVGILSCLGLSLLGVPLALALGTLAGLLTFVPYFGAVAAAVPAVLVALTVSTQSALWTVAIFVVCHGADSYIVSPLVQRRTIAMPPALSIVSMSILGELLGPIGVVLGAPAAAMALIVVREVYVGLALGDPEVGGPGEAGAAAPADKWRPRQGSKKGLLL